MNSGFDLRVMGLLLQQGRRVNALSLGLLALTALWLMLNTFGAGSLAALALGGLLLSLLMGLWQMYYAMRVDFDAQLLRALADLAAARQHSNEEAAALLDDSLRSLGLIKAEQTGRDWSARWQGMRRLLRWQLLCFGGQTALVLLAGIAAT